MSEHTAPSHPKIKVAIAGASGFVGRALIQKIKQDVDVIGLSRSPARTSDGVEWRQCDLFNLRQAEDGISGADVVVYLVHSMMPSAKLTQGTFPDIDLLIADNFARAAQKANIKKIIYLSGMMPDEKLSKHLASRLEVERALASHDVPCVSLRASLIIGKNGSSFEIMQKLVERLPIMICPRWTLTRTQPINLHDVVNVIAGTIQRDDIATGNYDIAGPDVLTYKAMMLEVARLTGKKRLLIPIFLFSPKLSRLWVRLVTGASRELIGPLVESLRHTMVARNSLIMEKLGISPKSLTESLRESLIESATPSPEKNLATNSTGRARPEINTVYSVQRLPMKAGWTADWVTTRYASWIIKFLWPFIIVEQSPKGDLCFKFRPFTSKLDIPLLRLTFARDRSSKHRQLFYISGGLLLNSRFHPRGRFEFREVLNGEFILVAICDFVPALPWWIYKNTQAIAHLFVMTTFRHHLKCSPASK